MFLIFDTETTGLPLSWRVPVSDVDNWPRLVQLAWAAFDARGRKSLARSYVIRPDGFTIPRDAERVHGVSTSVARRKGVPLADVLGAFMRPLTAASVLVAHNFKFDASVLGAEFHRLGQPGPFRRKTHICTMEAATEYCALPGPYGFKWPRLSELYSILFGKRVKEAHDAAADVATCSRCFFELKRLGIVRVRRVAPNNALKRTRARARVNI
ncbi:MAG: 3'-5' exonuclease [Terriglobia bacterium]